MKFIKTKVNIMANKTIKQMLIDLYREEREQMRCTLVHELKEEAKDVSLPYEGKVKGIQKKLSEFEREMTSLRTQINSHREERDNVLKSARLYNFGTKACGDALHPRLTEFDQLTNNHIKEILENTRKKQ